MLIEAVAGAGPGHAVVADAAELASLARAKRRRLPFGDDRVGRKILAAARHIEIRFLPTATARRHLFERDCSIQRRYQKVLEEAPAQARCKAASGNGKGRRGRRALSAMSGPARSVHRR